LPFPELKDILILLKILIKNKCSFLKDSKWETKEENFSYIHLVKLKVKAACNFWG